MSFDLRRLPVWLQYLVALSVIAVVAAAAWLVGRDRPVPHWVTHGIIPVLGWVYIAFAAYWVVSRILRWRRRS